MLQEKFGDAVRPAAETSDMPTFTVAGARLKEVLRFLKTEAEPRFRRLDDLTAVDESTRREREDYPDYTLVYQLLSFETPSRVRLKVHLHGTEPATLSITDIWPSANWYERECSTCSACASRATPALAAPHAPRLGGASLAEELPGPGHGHAAIYPGGCPQIQPLDAGKYLEAARETRS